MDAPRSIARAIPVSNREGERRPFPLDRSWSKLRVTMGPLNPVVAAYRRTLDRYRRKGRDPSLLKHMSELISMLEVATVLNLDLPGEEALDAALPIVMRELDVERAALFVRSEDGAWALRASRGLPPEAPSTLRIEEAPEDLKAPGPEDEVRTRHGLTLLCPIRRRDLPVALLGVGPRSGGRAHGARTRRVLRTVAACAAAPLESGVVHDELRRLTQKLSLKVFQLRNLFDISRELNVSFEEEALQGLIATAAMGHFVVSRCALYLRGPRGLVLAHQRGLRRQAESAPISPEESRAALEDLTRPKAVAELPDGPLRSQLEQARLSLAVPLAGGAGVEGVLAIGERASGTPFSEEDREFALTLARQALAALENARLHRLRLEKQRQDRELQMARDIQRSLLPPRPPEVQGFEVAAASRSCFEVGGDWYDWIDLGGGRLAVVIADVSGKGTPASLLMASVSASLRALAGTAAPARMIERLNRTFFANTQPERYVTLFYGELEVASRRLVYVNAGHIPPFRVDKGGTVSRLPGGGLALGLLGDAGYETGEVALQPGDVVAMVTDGVTEASSPEDCEFGDERIGATLGAGAPRGSAAALLERLLEAVADWTGGASSSDDQTALVLTVR
jgi:sigma-B regulation protein RsbU (phosphoserine phosphatase)